MSLAAAYFTPMTDAPPASTAASAAPAVPASETPPIRLDRRQRDRRRPWLWALLLALLLIAQTSLVALTLRFENMRRQEFVDNQVSAVAARFKQLAGRDLQGMQGLLWVEPSASRWRDDAAELMRRLRPLLRVEQRDARNQLLDAVASPYSAPLFPDTERRQFQTDLELACANALRRQATPQYSTSYFVPYGSSGEGVEVMDLCLPRIEGNQVRAYLVATVSLPALLEDSLTPEQARRLEFSFIDSDGTRLARSGLVRGSGVYKAERLIELPGFSMVLKGDSEAGSPGLIPALSTALVLGLSLALFAVVLLLARDGRKRAFAEHQLAQALAFRQAMENSLTAGLRARDMRGRITYVNQAFCAMVGFQPDELLGRGLSHGTEAPPPYWPPEHLEEYRKRLVERNAQAGGPFDEADPHQSFETVYMRANGERFPVMIFEAPLLDADGRQTGWMSAVLDVTDRHRMEELARQQQDRLQASARLAAVGEMASLLSHEINQPLAAIASYATAALNLLDRRNGRDDQDGHGEDEQTATMVREANARIAEQAERAGRVIKSVHDFVRRREQAHEAVQADQLIEAVLPLVRMQARKSNARVFVECADPAPTVHCDRTLVEQVLLNLARNAIQAMEAGTPPGERVLVLRIAQTAQRWVAFSVLDRGPGIAADVGRKLFTPFFTTRKEGMGLGLSLCRTVVEQHGGAMDYLNRDGGGCEFRFTLPASNESSSGNA
ncbi:MAG TPA: ATP-binding protein [Burkholderiaceae bacterium]|jgi:two-component system sensor histidine kinase DctS